MTRVSRFYRPGRTAAPCFEIYEPSWVPRREEQAVSRLERDVAPPNQLRKGWSEAAGSCGFNVNGPVYGAYVNGVALFVWQQIGRASCVVTGHLSHTRTKLEGAMVTGEALAMQYGRQG